MGRRNDITLHQVQQQQRHCWMAVRRHYDMTWRKEAATAPPAPRLCSAARPPDNPGALALCGQYSKKTVQRHSPPIDDVLIIRCMCAVLRAPRQLRLRK